MPRRLFASMFVLVASTVSAQDIQIDKKNQIITQDMQTLPLHIGGRTQSHPIARMPQGAASNSHEWPGVYFETSFVGDSLFLKFSDAANEYRLLIDGLPNIPLAQPGAVEIAVTGLGDGPHKARLEKVTESVWLIGAFDGFYAPKGRQAEQQIDRPLQIEFIGDSDMTGYGIRAPSRKCTPEQVRLTSDTQIAYPALVAKALNADYQINAISGRGLIRNYGGGSDHAMSAVYSEILPDVGDDAETSPYHDTQWKPDLFVIGLGDNDFSTPLLPTEKWPSNGALIADFLATYQSLLLSLHQASPNAALIILQLDPAILTEDEKRNLSIGMNTTILNTAKQTGFRSAALVSISDLSPQRTACDFHASQSDQQLRADWFVRFIKEEPNLLLQR